MSEQELRASAAERFRWTLGEFTLSYEPRLPRWHRWGLSAHGRGVGCCRNPLTAYVAWRRWMREPVTPSESA